MKPLKFHLQSCRDSNCTLNRHMVTVPKEELVKWLRKTIEQYEKKENYRNYYDVSYFIEKNYKEDL